MYHRCSCAMVWGGGCGMRGRFVRGVLANAAHLQLPLMRQAYAANNLDDWVRVDSLTHACITGEVGSCAEPSIGVTSALLDWRFAYIHARLKRAAGSAHTCIRNVNLSRNFPQSWINPNLEGVCFTLIAVPSLSDAPGGYRAIQTV